jgi:hypothetical protein
MTPPPPPNRQTVITNQTTQASVAGTTWAGTISFGHNEYTEHEDFFFQPDGSLHYKSPTGFWTNASWKQDNDTIYFEMNDKGAEYRGTINGNTMQGTARMASGTRTTWKAEKQSEELGMDESAQAVTATTNRTTEASVAGTTWAGTISYPDRPYKEREAYSFQPDGSLHWRDHYGFHDNGYWKQDRDRIYFARDNWFTKYHGIITGNTMQGVVSNLNGHSWTWTAEKQSEHRAKAEAPSTGMHSDIIGAFGGLKNVAETIEDPGFQLLLADEPPTEPIDANASLLLLSKRLKDDDSADLVIVSAWEGRSADGKVYTSIAPSVGAATIYGDAHGIAKIPERIGDVEKIWLSSVCGQRFQNAMIKIRQTGVASVRIAAFTYNPEDKTLSHVGQQVSNALIIKVRFSE